MSAKIFSRHCSQLFCDWHNFIDFMVLHVRHRFVQWLNLSSFVSLHGGHRLVPRSNLINCMPLHISHKFHSMPYKKPLVWSVLVQIIFLHSLQYIAFIAYGSLYNVTGHGHAETFEDLPIMFCLSVYRKWHERHGKEYEERLRWGLWLLKRSSCARCTTTKL